MPETRQTIVRLLSNIGSPREVSEYLARFSAIESTRFAVIKVGGAVLQANVEGLASALAFLHRVGLVPVVLHGAGPQLDEALATAGINTPKIDGLRATSAAALEVVRRVVRQENLRLVEALERMDVGARPLLTGVFEAALASNSALGLVGDVSVVHLDQVQAAVRAGQLPVLGCLGETAGGQIVNINADVAARELARALQPDKVIFLTSTGGLLDEGGQLLPSVNLAEDYEMLMGQSWLHSGMRLKIQQIEELLELLPASSSVSITDPEHLARELFTHSGSGTLVRRGERVLLYEGRDGWDTGRVAGLLESCFGRKLTNDYFDAKEFYRVYVSESYRATAILTREGDLPYLDKFGVTQKAQGEGLGRSVWLRMRAQNPRLFWRSRADNPINAWYFGQADGSFRSGPWTVFWYGLKGWDDISQAVERALAMPATLQAHGVGEGA